VRNGGGVREDVVEECDRANAGTNDIESDTEKLDSACECGSAHDDLGETNGPCIVVNSMSQRENERARREARAAKAETSLVNYHTVKLMWIELKANIKTVKRFSRI